MILKTLNRKTLPVTECASHRIASHRIASKIISISLILFFCINFFYAEEYTLFEDTYSITFYNNLSVKYRKNDILNVTKVIPFGEYNSIYFGKIGEDEFIAINKFTNDNSQILLPNNFLAAVFEKGSYLYPKYVVDTVFKQNRDYLSNFESENMKTMTIDDGSWGITYWYEREIKSQLISNEVLSLGSFFGLSTFFVKNIKKINKNEFEIFTIANIRILPGDLTKNYLFADIKNEQEVKFRLKKGDDYLELFVDNEESPRETYCYVNNDFRIAINKLVKNNSCENQNLTWPRHADGTCDYDDEIKPPVTQLSDNDFVAEEEEEPPTDSLPEIDTLETGDDGILTAGEETSVNKRSPDLSLLILIAAGVAVLIVAIMVVVIVRKKKHKNK